MKSIIEILKDKGLKVTPQRVAILQAVYDYKHHPTADNIIECTKKSHPNISVATVYKVLETLVDNHLLIKVKTEKDSMRYDPLLINHHHLYCVETDKIEDYEDQELDKLITDYFKKKKITNFKIKDIKLQITGEFK